MSDILLEATAEGERLKLAGAGAWIAENARSLEAQIDAATGSDGAGQARRYRHGPRSSGSTPSAPGCWSG